MEQAPLVYALVHALDRAITGEMVFRSPAGDAHTVTFFEGAAVRVEPGGEGDRVGEDLVAMDELREEALAEALVTAQTSRRRLGELLVNARAVDPTSLTYALTLQTAKRLAALANLPAASTFSLYFSARAEPEPYAPWAPLDSLLATIRAWTDRTRLHGTLRRIADKRLHLSPEAELDGLMLTSRERDALAIMQTDSPSLRQLYESVGNGLSSFLYMLAVTRQFEFTSAKGAPMGHRKEPSLIRDFVQVAVPIAPVIVSSGDTPSDAPPPPAPEPTKAAEPRPVEPSSPPPRPDVPAAPPARRAPPRPSFSPPRAGDPGRPPGRISDVPRPESAGGPNMSSDFRLAEDAAKRHDYATAARLLRDNCTDEDAAEAEFQALSAWVKANLKPEDLNTPLNDLTFLLMAHNQCEAALYYRGLLLKRSGKAKAALRDFIILAKKNPNHAGALTEIKLLRDAGTKG